MQYAVLRYLGTASSAEMTLPYTFIPLNSQPVSFGLTSGHMPRILYARSAIIAPFSIPEITRICRETSVMHTFSNAADTWML